MCKILCQTVFWRASLTSAWLKDGLGKMSGDTTDFNQEAVTNYMPQLMRMK